MPARLQAVSIVLCSGPLILETKQSSLFNLVHRCRRFFPAGKQLHMLHEQALFSEVMVNLNHAAIGVYKS